MNVVRVIQRFNDGREPERLRLKYKAMRASDFAFLRGGCHLFYKRLPHEGVLKSAPPAWVCGDLHLQNFGSYKGDNRLVYFDLNDFDEAALAPASWDLLRLLASVHVAAGTLAWKAAQADALCSSCLDAYAAALSAGKAYWIERDTAQGLVHELLDALRARQRKTLLRERTTNRGGQRRLRTDGRHALAASDAQRDAVACFMRAHAAGQRNPAFFEVLDVARRVAGTGSLGLERYVVLVHGKGAPDGHYLLDLKAAQPSSLAPRLRLAQPDWPSEAHRIVALQRRLQAVSMAFLEPVMLDGRPFVLRALQPREDRVPLDAKGLARGPSDAQALPRLLADLGRLTAWAHLRGSGRGGAANADALIDFGSSHKWRESLLGLSREAAAQVRRDAKAFNEAYDDGAFAV